MTIGSTTVDSTYNGQGLRVRKTVTTNGVTTTTLFFYDEAGRLLGEYAGNGALIQETVWFGGLPVATIRPDGVYYVQADHLGTPRAVLRPSDNAVVWRWDSDPFGSTPAQEATVNGQPFKYHLRFPGQYLDAETGLHYNVFRDYDPVIGRYVQADPIGLAGGINTYAYVGGNPVSYVDQTGLWSATINIIPGLGGGVTFGVDGRTGQPFVVGRIGFGDKFGVAIDPNGGRPGAPGRGDANGGWVFGVAGDAGLSGTLYGLGPEGSLTFGFGRDYGSDQGLMNFPPTLHGQIVGEPGGRTGVSAGFWGGLELGYYGPRADTGMCKGSGP